MAKQTVECKFCQDRCFYLSGDERVESIVKLRKETGRQQKRILSLDLFKMMFTFHHGTKITFCHFHWHIWGLFFDFFWKHLKLGGRSTMQNCTKLTRLHSPDLYMSHVVHIARKHDVDS